MAAKKSAPKREDSPANADEPSIDAVLEGLEGVVDELERGDLPLEAALARFEHGVKLARTGGRLLDGVEQRVEVLLAERDEVVPLDGEDAGEADDV